MPNKALKVVGEFEDHGVKVLIYQKQDESAEEAIERVAKKHGFDPKKVKRP